MPERYDDRTVLLAVDIQNDFADPDGTLSVPGGHEIIPLVNREIDRARDEGDGVLYTQDWHPPETPHFAAFGGIWPVHCVADTWGAAFHPDLTVDGDVVRKGQDGRDGYSGFSVRDLRTGERAPTVLEELLRARRAERIVIVGLATDYCVVETVVDARRLGYDVEVLGEAVRAVDLRPGDGDAALARMRDAGATLT